jgi:hypothetical protein
VRFVSGYAFRHIASPRLLWAELRFQLRAAELGLILAKPCRDNAPYDFVVACPERANRDRRDHHGHFLRVQVKCTLQRREKNSYRCCLDHNGSPYTPAQIDFFAAYVIPADVFYILPLAATHSQPDILLTPHRQNSKYSQYKEAWHLLMSEP